MEVNLLKNVYLKYIFEFLETNNILLEVGMYLSV